MNYLEWGSEAIWANTNEHDYGMTSLAGIAVQVV